MPFEYGIRDYVGSREVTVDVPKFEALKAGELGVRKFIRNPADAAMTQQDHDYGRWIPLVGNIPRSVHVHKDGLGQEIFEGLYTIDVVASVNSMAFAQVIAMTPRRVKIINLRDGHEGIKDPSSICIIPTELIEGTTDGV